VSPWGHLAAALPLAAAVYYAGGSPLGAVAAGAASVLVDLDHVADYIWLQRGRFRLRGFYLDYRRHLTSKLFLLLHSWELALLALVFSLLWSAPPILRCLVAGWIYHLACDQLANRVGAPFYFISYRFSKGFERRLLPCPQGHPKP
jgi:hypothetical protein